VNIFIFVVYNKEDIV